MMKTIFIKKEEKKKGTQKAGFVFGQDTEKRFGKLPRWVESSRERRVKVKEIFTKRTPVKTYYYYYFSRLSEAMGGWVRRVKMPSFI